MRAFAVRVAIRYQRSTVEFRHVDAGTIKAVGWEARKQTHVPDPRLVDAGTFEVVKWGAKR